MAQVTVADVGMELLQGKLGTHTHTHTHMLHSNISWCQSLSGAYHSGNATGVCRIGALLTNGMCGVGGGEEDPYC